MNSFYIAMGQGIIANADVEFFTEALYSCTFIAGCDASRTRAGAFHFPAGEFRSVRPVLDQWLVALNPAEVTLVFANPDIYLRMGTPEVDQVGLQHWLSHGYGIDPATTTATSAGVRLAGGQFYAGSTRGSLLWDPEVTRDVTAAEPGQHTRYQLFDARDRMTPTAPAVVQEATSGRRKRRRSWLRRHGCIVM
jgi:hypothetical protein